MLAVHHLGVAVQGLSVRISYSIWSQQLQIQSPLASVLMTRQLRIMQLNSLKYMSSELHSRSNRNFVYIHSSSYSPLILQYTISISHSMVVLCI